MHDLALSVVRSKGVPKLEGSITMLEYRYGMLTVQYRSGLGQLDVWFTRKVLSIERFAGKPQLIHYIPGHWGHHRIGVAKVAGKWDRRAARAARFLSPCPSLKPKGRFVTVGVMTFKEYRAGKLSVVLMPGPGNLDIWYRHKVLSFRQKLGVTLYTRGRWEDELEAAVGKPLKHSNSWARRKSATHPGIERKVDDSVDKETSYAEATMHSFGDVAIICGWVIAVYAISHYYWR